MDLPILMYHDLVATHAPLDPYSVSLAAFLSQLDMLEQLGMTTISFRDLLPASPKEACLPSSPVLLTFDDGYQSFAELALPALVSRGMKATVFIVAGAIGGSNTWDTARRMATRRLMDAHAIQRSLAAGIELGAHGWVHRNLIKCSTDEEHEEIARPGPEIERRFGVRPLVYSYPFGAHARRHFSLLQDAGYLGAVSIFSDQPTVTSNVFSMRRIYIHGADNLLRFRFKLWPGYLRYVAWRDRGFSIG